MVGDDGVRVSGGVREELFYMLHCVFSGVCLLGGDGVECDEHCGIYRLCVVEESTCYFLEKNCRLG